MKEQYEIHWVDYYALLQVQPSAELEVIDGAYKQLMLKYHPDKNSTPEAADKVKLLNEAKEILRDPARRARYDEIHGTHREAPRASEQRRLAQARRRLRKEVEQEDWREQLRKPHVLVSPREIDLGQCARGETRVCDLTIRVSQGRAVIGDISADKPWIKFNSTELFGSNEQVQVVVDTSALAAGRRYAGTLTIKTVLFGSRVIPIKIYVNSEPAVTEDAETLRKTVRSIQPETKYEEQFLADLKTQLKHNGWRPNAQQMAKLQELKDRRTRK